MTNPPFPAPQRHRGRVFALVGGTDVSGPTNRPLRALKAFVAMEGGL